MGFTPRGRGGFRGGRGRGGGGRFSEASQGPPDEVVEVGSVLHPCQEDIVCKLTNEKVPYFNAPVYLQNKEEVGKIDEIFGPIKEAYFSVKLTDTLKSKSFKEGVKFYMDPFKFLTLDRVLNANSSRGRGGGRGGRGGDSRGGRGGGPRGGRGGGRGDFHSDRGGRGGFRGSRGGGRGDFHRGRGDSHGDRGGFRGGRGDFRGGRGSFRGGRGGEAGNNSFHGKRESSNFSPAAGGQNKKMRFDE
ncbi:unnamed protein product [Calicophoron daubneyi]|uniref:H/ACA ribonucleoprotein complex subunit n=1 Tax=Calicophoron daubneyi TaxID=300641 RepID=A0AAV2TAQ3_CALDB